jgi:hypothetical protein
MEPDRYQLNKKLFILSMLSLLLCLPLLAFALFLFPFLIFNWVYDIPSFIYEWREWLKESYSLSTMGAGLLIFLFFFTLSLLFGFISRKASNHIDEEIYHIEAEAEGLPDIFPTEAEEPPADIGVEESTEPHAAFYFSIKLLLIVLSALAVVFFISWLLTTPLPRPLP